MHVLTFDPHWKRVHYIVLLSVGLLTVHSAACRSEARPYLPPSTCVHVGHEALKLVHSLLPLHLHGGSAESGRWVFPRVELHEGPTHPLRERGEEGDTGGSRDDRANCPTQSSDSRGLGGGTELQGGGMEGGREGGREETKVLYVAVSWAYTPYRKQLIEAETMY